MTLLTLTMRRLVRRSLGVPRAARSALAWDTMAGALAGLYIGSVFPFVTRTAKDLHATDAALAWISAAPFLGNLLSPLWAAQMVGRAKMPFCVWGWSAARALFLLMPFVTAPWPFALLMVSIQVLGTMPSPAYAALMKDLYPDETRGRLMGYVRATVQTTTLLGTLIAGRLLDNQLSFRTLFPAAALSGIAAALVFSRCKTATPLPDSSGQQRPSLRETLLPLVENPPFRWFALSVMFYGLGNLMAQPLYALFQIERLGVRNTDIADIANAAALSAIGGSFLWGRFLDRYGAARTVFFAICLVTSTSVVYFFARTLAPLYLASALFGFGLSGIELSYMASILAYAEPGQTARYQSLHSLLLGIRGILAPLIALPLLRWAGWQATFAITFGLMLIGAVLQFLAMRKER